MLGVGPPPLPRVPWTVLAVGDGAFNQGRGLSARRLIASGDILVSTMEDGRPRLWNATVASLSRDTAWEDLDYLRVGMRVALLLNLRS